MILRSCQHELIHMYARTAPGEAVLMKRPVAQGRNSTSKSRTRRPRATDGADVPAALGARVRSIRIAKGWTQEQIATLAGLKPETISRVETGAVTPDLDTLGKLVRALDVTFGIVLDGRGSDDGEELVGALAELRKVLVKLRVPEQDLVIRLARALANK